MQLLGSLLVFFGAVLSLAMSASTLLIGLGVVGLAATRRRPPGEQALG